MGDENGHNYSWGPYTCRPSPNLIASPFNERSLAMPYPVQNGLSVPWSENHHRSYSMSYTRSSGSDNSSSSCGDTMSPLGSPISIVSSQESYWPPTPRYVQPTELEHRRSPPVTPVHAPSAQFKKRRPSITSKITPEITPRGNAIYTCVHANCSSKAQFKRATDLKRHIRTQHFPQENRIDCDFAWCGRTGEHGFTRADHKIEHLREVHRVNIPKGRTRR